ncbi:hypothetical protein NC652_034344 [Populus alba x Populus x berolinensis]|nr:hypothetical protein NC652_034344 [Populus alba x Populus x berolinensis]
MAAVKIGVGQKCLCSDSEVIFQEANVYDKMFFFDLNQSSLRMPQLQRQFSLCQASIHTDSLSACGALGYLYGWSRDHTMDFTGACHGLDLALIPEKKTTRLSELQLVVILRNEMNILRCQGDCPSKQVMEWGLRHDTIFVSLARTKIDVERLYPSLFKKRKQGQMTENLELPYDEDKGDSGTDRFKNLYKNSFVAFLVQEDRNRWLPPPEYCCFLHHHLSIFCSIMGNAAVFQHNWFKYLEEDSL